MKNNAKDILAGLLPRPAQAMATGNDYILNKNSIVECFGSGRKSLSANRLASLTADEWGIHLPVRENRTGQGYFLRIIDKPKRKLPPAPCVSHKGTLGNEGYHLEVDAHGVRLEADTAQGLLWGAMTIRQLIIKGGNKKIVCGAQITDRPRYAWRGFQIDSGRSPNSIKKIKRIIRICSAFKLNFLVFREGDDELNAVRYKSNPLGSENPFAISLKDLAELSAYARDHGITLVPEVESLGHSTAKGIHYPEIVSGGFKQDYTGLGYHIRKSHLTPCDPRSLKLLNSIYRDLAGHLHPPMIHLGMDEVRLPKDVQARHLKAVMDILFHKAGADRASMSALVWADCPPTPDEYKDRVIRCLWEYGDGDEIGFENEKLMKRMSLGALADPACQEQVFMAGGSGSARHIPYCKSTYKNAFHNLASWANFGNARGNFTGLFAVQWSGNMTDLWLPDFLCAADFGWRPPADDIPSFQRQYRRIQRHLSRLADARSPRPDEVDRPAWDGIWLNEKKWDAEVLPPLVRRRLNALDVQKRK